MGDHQVCGIMAALIYSRLIELDGWTAEDAMREAVFTAKYMMREMQKGDANDKPVQADPVG